MESVSGQNNISMYDENPMLELVPISDNPRNCSPKLSRPSDVILISPTRMPESSVECREPGAKCCELRTGVSSVTSVVYDCGTMGL